MAIELKHSFVSAVDDGPNDGSVRPSDWNANHVLTLNTARLVGRTTAGVGVAEEISIGSGLSLNAGVLGLVFNDSIHGSRSGGNLHSSATTSEDGFMSSTDKAFLDGVQAQLNAKAPLASPALTGTPTAPTASGGTNTTQIATTAFVSAALASLVDGAPGLLDTLDEIAAALGDDPNFATTMTNALNLKAPLASPALTGTPTAPTAAVNTNTTQIATTAYVVAQIADDAPTKSGGGATGTWGISISGSAAQLNGQSASYYTDIVARLGYTPLNTTAYTAADVRTKLLTVDGSGSGVDADLLDGQHGSSYLRADQTENVMSGMLVGGFGAQVTTVNEDWNHVSNARSGQGYTLLNGTDANGPGPSDYFHPFSFEYTSKNGSGNLTQLAIPYRGSAANETIYLRTRFGGDWQPWRKFWTDGNDGTGSGLDADLLDGQQGSYYLNAGNLNAGTIPDARISGTYTGLHINTTGTLEGALKHRRNGGYFYIGNHSSSYGDGDVRIWWNDTTKELRLHEALDIVLNNNTDTVWHTGNDGTDSGLDADLLDGKHGSYYGIGITDIATKDWDTLSPGWEADLLTPASGNSPDGTYYYYALVMQHNSSQVQIAFPFGGSVQSGNARMHIRGEVNGGGAFSAWKSIPYADQVSLLDAANTFIASPQTVRVSESYGGISLVSGDANYPGYINIINPDGSLKAHFGYSYTSGNKSSAVLLYTDSASHVEFNVSPKVSSNIVWHAGNDGTGSGLDADLLDGQHGSYYTDIVSRLGYTPLNTTAYTAADVLSKLLTVDGSGSGLDADLLDGLQATAFDRLNANTEKSGFYTRFYSPSGHSVPAGNTGSLHALEVYQATSGADAVMTFHVGSDWAVYFGLDGGLNDLVVGGWSMGANAYRIWHQGNDGAGSGLDADTVDGIQAASFLTRSGGSNYYQAATWIEVGSSYGLYSTTNSAHISPNADNSWSPWFVRGNRGGYNGLSFELTGGNGNVNLLLNHTGSLMGLYNTAGGWIVNFQGSGNMFLYSGEFGGGSAYKVWHTGNDGAGSGLDADLLDGLHATEWLPLQSSRDFPNGTLIQTSFPYGSSGSPWLLEITGNSYGAGIPFNLKAQGYVFNGGMINITAISAGLPISGLVLFEYGGNLCFWFPYGAYWQGFTVTLNNVNAGEVAKRNLVTSITNAAKPSGITKEYAIPVTQVWHNGNDGSGSGLDADLLDGQHGSYYAPINQPIFTGSVASIQSADGGGAGPAYLSFRNSSSTQIGYIGYTSANTNMYMYTASGAILIYAVGALVFSGYSNSTIISSVTTSGAIYLRPNGNGSSSGQAVLNSSGVLSAAQLVSNNGNFVGSASTALLGTSGASGNVYLRPNGNGSTAGQAHLSSAGLFTTGYMVLNKTGSVALATFNTDTANIQTVLFQLSGVGKGSVVITESGTLYNTTSDYRLKTNWQPIMDAKDRMLSIPVWRGEFIGEPGVTMDYFIAHELADAVPNAVQGTKDAVDISGKPIYQEVDYSKLIPLHHAAIQDLFTEQDDILIRLRKLEAAFGKKKQ